MTKSSVVATASALCWAGAVTIVGAGFTSCLGDDVDQIKWSRLSSLLITLGAVLSLVWVFDRYVVTPRSAFKLGMEAGERRARRSAGTSGLRPFKGIGANGDRTTPAR